MKQVMPLYGGGESGSDFASRNTTPLRRPFVTHIFWPLITQSSPSFLARVEIACTSDPSPGSDSEKAARISPVAMRGRNLSFCSSLPNFISREEPMKWVLTMPEIEIQPLESSSTIIA